MRFSSSLRHLSFAFGIVATTLALGQAPPVATGDTRAVSEPVFPQACQVLRSSFHDVNTDVPTAVEAQSTNLDQSRLQAALNSCAGSNQAVELSMDGAGNNAFLSGPINIPSGVTLLVDPGVTLYFSRNAQDYDTTPGTHTCGTVSGASNTASCQNLISMNNVSNAGIMGYGKLDGRGGDVVLNSFPTSGYEGSTTGKTWWDLANDAGTVGGAQQNPRGLQISRGTNITLYKITFKNAPNFHVAVNFVNGFTVWGMHIVTPYSAHNTDGIDPGNATNVTITQSWISDGDDNIALGANAGPTANVSVIHNHFFAGHGESIGSLTNFGVNNALFDDNAMYGDAELDGSNSTAIRIKSANDRGGLVQNIQYSNSCFADHGTQMQFTPVYNTNAGSLTPNFKNILLQNLRFSAIGPVTTGSYTFLGASNNGTVNPLGITLDNVTIDTLTSSNLVAPVNAHITLGPGQVSNYLASLLLADSGSNGNIVVDNRSGVLNPPACNFVFLAPSLTGPTGVNQTVTTGQFPTAVVLLQPGFAAAQAPFATGTVTVTDEAQHSVTATLPGNTDTIFIPITNAPAGTHTYTASYSGDSVYPAISSFGNYSVTVSGPSLPSTTTTLSGVPASITYGTTVMATATLAGSNNPGGAITFLVNGVTAATVPLTGNSATYTLSPSTGSYTITAVYDGDSANAGSSSQTATLSVGSASTTTTLQSASTTGLVGTPVTLTANVKSPAGVPAGTVTFSYTTATNGTPVTLGSSTLNNGSASYAALLPQGTDSIVATYTATTNFAGSVSSPALVITVSGAAAIPASTAPVALPYLVSTLVGGGTSNATCTGHVDSFGDGCVGTSIVLPSGDDLRTVTGDPFGNVYFVDSTSSLVRKVAPNGVVTQFAGYVSGTSCTPTATVGCLPTQVKLGGKPRGIYADPLGNLFIAGYGDNKVQFVRAADGKMYLVAGTGTAPTSTSDSAGDGGPAATALLKGPRAIATDMAGNVYIADSGDNRIREVLAPSAGLPGTGNIQTIAGTGTASDTGDGGLATAATLNNPNGVAVDSNGNVYIAQGSRVRVVCVNCASGTGLYGLLNKLGVASPVSGNIYTVAGASSGSNTTLKPGLANTVSMSPQKISLDADGNLYIADAGNGVIWFEDGRTGYTRVLVGGGTATSCAGSAIGDGCAGPQAVIGSNGGNGFGVGLDAAGNLYVADSTNLRIRKVSTGLRFPATATGTSATQTIDLHSQPGDSLNTPTVPLADFQLAAGGCTSLPDSTQDCLYTATFTPAAAGLREAPLSVSTALNNPGAFTLAGLGTGAGATLDPAATQVFGQNLSPASIALDPAGNVLIADTASKHVLRFAQGSASGGAGASGTVLGSFNNPSAVAADALGNLYVADTASGLVTKIAANGTSSGLPLNFTAPSALATDSFDNLFVLDSGAKTVTEIGSNGLGTRIIATGLTAPSSLAVDSSGNVFVGDSNAINRIDVQTLASTKVSSAVASPAALAVDAAGNLLIADASQGSLLAIPFGANSAPFTLVTGVPANTLALDGAGNVYTTSGNHQAEELLRTQGLAAYSAANGSSTVNLLSTGTAALNLSFSDPDTTNFKFAATSSSTCMVSGSSVTVGSGGVCTFASSFTPSAAGNFSNTITFAGNAANSTATLPLKLTQTGSNGTAAAGPPQLISTSQIVAMNGGYQVTVTIQNNGGSAAGVVLSSLALGNAAGTSLPVALGTIAQGGSASATVFVPSSAGASGSAVVERIGGTYNGGSFGGSLRTRLP